MVEKLKNDMIEAMKNKDKDRLAVIRMVKAAMDLEHIDHKREINDENLKRTPASISFVPSVAGLIIASEVVKDIIKHE